MFTLAGTTYKKEICTDESHKHFGNGVLHLFSVRYKDHLVEVTKEENLYHVRVDGGLPALDMTYQGMVDFVENETR